MNEQEKRGVGRPSQGKVHIDLTLSEEVVRVLREMPAGKRSQFVDEWLRQHPQIKAKLKHGS